jgi:hypothetical protein
VAGYAVDAGAKQRSGGLIVHSFRNGCH